MSEVVDTRIVEAKFDSKQFEKGVDKTVKKLDELKKSLNLEDTGKSIADLASKATDAADKATSSLEKLENRITSFTGMLKQKLLGGIADEVVGVFFKIKNGFESLVSSLSSAQVSYGMQRYTDILTSVRTLTATGVKQGAAYSTIERLGAYADQTSYSLDQLVSTMSKFKTAGAALSTAERMVVGLSNAAASMGVNANDAARAYLNMQQAYSKGYMMQNDWISFESLPMVGEQFNKAILEAAEKVGTLVKQRNGTYSTSNKEDKQVRTSGADAKGITAENLGTKLSSRWFNKAVMEEVFGATYYFSITDNETINAIKRKEDELKKKIGTEENGIKYTEENFEKEFEDYLKNEVAVNRRLEKEKELNDLLDQGLVTEEERTKLMEEFEKTNNLTKFSWDAYRAGQEARSLTDVLNTLKDTISRGWATSFEYIFGKLDEAADFFTKLADSNLANAIYNIGYFRNEILRVWSTSGGRNDLLSGLEELDEILGDILGKFNLFSDSEGEDFQTAAQTIGFRLSEASRNFKDFTANLSAWLHETDGNGAERIDRITDAVKSLSVVFHGLSNAVSIAFKFVKQVFAMFGPTLGSLAQSIQKVMQPILDLINPQNVDAEGNNAYIKFQDMLGNILKVAEPLANVLPTVISVLGDVGSFFVSIVTGSAMRYLEFFADGIGFILELFGKESAQSERGVGVIDNIKSSIVALGDECKKAIEAVGDFFSSLIQDIRELFGIGVDKKEGGFFDNILNFFETNEFIKTVSNWFTDAFTKIGDFVRDLPNRIQELSVNIGDVFKSLLWKKGWSEKTYKGIQSGSATAAEQYKKAMMTPLNKILTAITSAIKQFILNIPKTVTKLIEGAGSIIRTVIRAIFGVKDEKDASKEAEKELLKPFEHASIDGIINTIKGWGKTLLNQIASIFTGSTDIESNQKRFSQVIADGIDTIRKKAEEIWPKVEAWFINLPGNIADFFTGKKAADGEGSTIGKAVYDFVVQIGEHLTAIPNKLIEKWKESKTNFNSLWERIKSTFTNGGLDSTFSEDEYWKLFGNGTQKERKAAEDYRKEHTNVIVENITKLVSTIGESLSGIPGKVLNYIKNNASKFSFKDVWDHIVFQFKNGGVDGEFSEERYKELLSSDADEAKNYKDEHTNPIIRNLVSFIKDTGEFFKTIPTRLTDAWNSANVSFSTMWKEIIKQFKNGGIDSAFSEDEYWKLFGNGTEAEKKKANDYKNEHTNPFIKALSSFVNDTLVFLTGIPTTLLRGYEAAKVEFGTLWDTIIDGITNGGLDKSFDRAVYESLIGEGRQEEAETYKKEHTNMIFANISEFISEVSGFVATKISELPTAIVEGLNAGADVLKMLLEAITGWFSGAGEEKPIDKMEDEINKELENEDAKVFLSALADFGTKLKDLISTTIPDFFVSGFNAIRDNSAGMWTALGNVFEGDGSEESIKKGINDIGIKIENAIKTLPTYIHEGAKWVREHLFSFTRKETTDMTEAAKKGLSNFNISDAVIKRGSSTLEDQKVKKVFDQYYGRVKYNFLTGQMELEDDLEDEAETFNLAETMKAFGLSIVSAVEELGPYVIEAANKVLELLGKGISWVTDFFNTRDKNDSILESLEKKLSSENPGSEVSGFVESLRTIGATIGNLITKIIPDFITSAIDEVAAGIPKLWNRLFGGNKEHIEKEATAAVSTVGMVAAKVVDNYSDENGGGTSFLDAFLTGSGLLSAAHADEITMMDRLDLIKYFEERLKTTVDEAEKTNIRNDIQALKVLGENVKEIDLLTFKFTSSIFKKDPDSGKILNNVKKREYVLSELINQMADTDQMLQDAEMIADPENQKKLQEKYNTLQAWVKELSGSKEEFVEASKYIYTEDTTADFYSSRGLFGVLERIMGFFNSFDSSDALNVAAKAASVIVIAWALKNIFDSINFLDEPGYDAKWIAFSAAIIGVVAILGWVTYLASYTDDAGKQRYDHVISTLKKVGDFIERLAGLIQNIAIVMAVKEGLETVGDIASATGKVGEKTLAGTIVKILALFAAPTVLSQQIENVFDSLGTSFVEIGEGIDSFLEYLNPTIEKLVAASGNIEDAINALDGVKRLLFSFNSLINSVVLDNGMIVLPDDEEMLENYEVLLTSKTKGTGNYGEAINIMSDDLEKRMTFIYQITAMMDTLADALKKMESIEDPAAQISRLSSLFKKGSKTYAEFSDFVENAVLLIYDSLLKPFSGSIDALDTAAIGFEMLGNALSIFGNGISGMTPENVTALGQMLDVFKSLAEAFGEQADNQTPLDKLVFGETSLSRFGKQIKQFGVYLKSFFDNIKKAIPSLDDNAVRDLEARIGYVLQVAQGMAEVVTTLGSDVGAGFLPIIGDHLSKFGTDVGKFINAINLSLDSGSDGDSEKAALTLERMHSIAEIMSAVGELMLGVGSILPGTFKFSTDDIGKYVKAFFESIEEYVFGENNLPDVALQAGIDYAAQFFAGVQIEMQEHDLDKPKIVPVLEISDDFVEKANQMRAMLGFDKIAMDEMGNWNIPETSLDMANSINIPMQKDYEEQLKGIDTKLENAVSGINSFSSSLASSRFILKSSDVVIAIGPEMNEYLGQEGYIEARHDVE